MSAQHMICNRVYNFWISRLDKRTKIQYVKREGATRFAILQSCPESSCVIITYQLRLFRLLFVFRIFLKYVLKNAPSWYILMANGLISDMKEVRRYVERWFDDGTGVCGTHSCQSVDGTPMVEDRSTGPRPRYDRRSQAVYGTTGLWVRKLSKTALRLLYHKSSNTAMR